MGRNESFCSIYLIRPRGPQAVSSVPPEIGGFAGNLVPLYCLAAIWQHLLPIRPSDRDAFSSVLSNDFSGSERSSRRRLYGTFHGGDIRDDLAAYCLKYTI